LNALGRATLDLVADGRATEMSPLRGWGDGWARVRATEMPALRVMDNHFHVLLDAFG